jgi:hypothetical protein
MADPGASLSYGGAAISAISNIYGAYAAIKTSKYQQDILNYRAKYVAAVQKIEEEKIRRNVRKVIGSQRAATAASGFQNIGTPQELEIQSEIQGDIDIALLRQSGSMEQLRLMTAGTLARAEGYGRAAGYIGKATSVYADTLLSAASRHGWFKPKTDRTIPPPSAYRQRWRNP